MPRTQLDRKPEPIPKLIYGQVGALGITMAELAAGTGISRATLYGRLKDPKEFKVGELLRVSRYLHIPIDELRASIQF